MNHGGNNRDTDTTEENSAGSGVVRSPQKGIYSPASAPAGTANGGIHPAPTATAGHSAASEAKVSDDPLSEYRKHCVSAEQKAQEDYDKAVLTLSGGALGISFAFLKDVVGPGPLSQVSLLLAAWLLWGGSIVSTLTSFWFSQLALRTAIAQVDKNTIRDQFPGRAFSRITSGLNALGGLAFVAGVVLMVLFVMANIGHVHPAELKVGK
jgi:hypothetical protein